MKKIKLNTKFLATEGIPQLLTVGIVPATSLAYFCGWVNGVVDTTFCAVVFMLSVFSIGYSEWELVKGKISKLHFGLFGVAFLCLSTLGSKLYAMTEATSTQKLFVLAVVMLPCLMVYANYNNSVHKAEKYEEKDRERCMALAGYKALWSVTIFLLAYSACFRAVYYFGDALSDFLGTSRLAAWQTAMHNMLN